MQLMSINMTSIQIEKTSAVLIGSWVSNGIGLYGFMAILFQAMVDNWALRHPYQLILAKNVPNNLTNQDLYDGKLQSTITLTFPNSNNQFFHNLFSYWLENS